MRIRVSLGGQARRVSTALEKCRKELAEPDGFPKYADRLYPRPPSSGFAEPLYPLHEEFYRLKSWLDELTNNANALAYAALLQIWLDAHGVEWPKGVFAPVNDIALRGRGRPQKEVDRDKVTELLAQGKKFPDIATQPDIAEQLGIKKPRTPSEKRRAGDRLRKVYRKSKWSVGSLDEVVTELGLKMLGMMTPQEGRDIMREALGPDYDIPADS